VLSLGHRNEREVTNMDMTTFLQGLMESGFKTQPTIIRLLENRNIHFQKGKDKLAVFDDETSECWTIEFNNEIKTDIRKGNLTISRQIAEASKLSDDDLIDLLITATYEPWRVEMSYDILRKELKDRLK
jgi:hypothetical protein